MLPDLRVGGWDEFLRVVGDSGRGAWCGGKVVIIKELGMYEGREYSHSSSKIHTKHHFPTKIHQLFSSRAFKYSYIYSIKYS